MKSYITRAIVLFVVFLIVTFVPHRVFGQNVLTYIHPRAAALMPTIKDEVGKFQPSMTIPWYYPGLMEHESCITLKHSKCWNSQAELRNNREHGLGLGQLTRAWDVKGKLRFDNLEAYRSKYPRDLWELSWDTFKNRPDLQIRVTVLMVRDIEKRFIDIKDPYERFKMTDSAYNGGESHVKRAREACKLTKGCNPSVWYSNVEIHLPKSKAPDARYGGQSMYSINTKHVRDVFENRMPKFKQFWND